LNLNYKYADTGGRVVNVDLVRGFYKGRGASYQPNTYRDPKTEQVTGIRNFSNNLPVDINIYTAKVDYEMPFKKGKLEAGIKTSYVASDNKFELYNEYPSRELDVNRSNRFKYKENINAAYTNYNFSLSKQVNLQAGVRLEQTVSTGDLTPYDHIASDDDHVKRKYLDLFPSTAITWKLNDKNTLNLTYSRRIDRPSYQDLNPFENKLDELSYDKGNAFLKPQYTNNIELTHSFKGSINTSLNYTLVDNYIALVNDTIDGKAIVITPQNLKRQELYGIVISASIPITKWMGIYWYGNFNRRNIQHSFSPGKLVDLRVNGYSTYLQTNFDLGKGYSTEVSGWVIGGALWGVFKQSTYGSCDIGFQKKLFSNKANIKLSFNDIFFSTPSTYTSNLGASYMTFTNRSENRAVKLTFTWRFGRTEVKGARDRKTGSETESGRIKQS
jgi:outer membrane receptor protein involved in Fe transport